MQTEERRAELKSRRERQKSRVAGWVSVNQNANRFFRRAGKFETLAWHPDNAKLFQEVPAETVEEHLFQRFSRKIRKVFGL